MLPIDENAKSGEWVWCRHLLRAQLFYVRFNGGEWWDGERSYPANFFSEYIPHPWIEHAGAMREALEDVKSDHQSSYETSIETDRAIDTVLTATEWPPKPGSPEA